MPGPAPGGIDMRTIISTILNVIKSKSEQSCVAPCDGFVLKMHYRWTFLSLFVCFCCTWYQWFTRELITCASHFEATNQVRMDYVNICLSYPFVLNEDKSKRYLLFYRWIHYSFLLIAGLYYIPRKLSKSLENQKVKRLIDELSANACRYDQTEQEILKRAIKYITFNLKTHNSLYINFMVVNIVALAIDVIAMLYLDFLLLGKFKRYGFNAFPFNRDPENYSDYMSQMFPPFVKCTIGKTEEIMSERTEQFGCHLTFMELYEKLFIVLWFWLIIQMTVTAVYIINFSLMLLPKIRSRFLITSKAIHITNKMRKTVADVSLNVKVGDIYVLYCFKKHLSPARFYELLSYLTDEDRCIAVGTGRPMPKKEEEIKEHMLKNEEEVLIGHQKHQLIDQLRQRHPGQEGNPSSSPMYPILPNQVSYPGGFVANPNFPQVAINQPQQQQQSQQQLQRQQQQQQPQQQQQQGTLSPQQLIAMKNYQMQQLQNLQQNQNRRDQHVPAHQNQENPRGSPVNQEQINHQQLIAMQNKLNDQREPTK